MGCIAYLGIIWQLAVNGRASVATKGGKVSAFYGSIAGFTLLVWTAYPMYVFSSTFHPPPILTLPNEI
jgi:bacteriorhodopsin